MSIRSHGDPIQVEERIECILATAPGQWAVTIRGLFVRGWIPTPLLVGWIWLARQELVSEMAQRRGLRGRVLLIEPV